MKKITLFNIAVGALNLFCVIVCAVSKNPLYRWGAAIATLIPIIASIVVNDRFSKRIERCEKSIASTDEMFQIKRDDEGNATSYPVTDCGTY